MDTTTLVFILLGLFIVLIILVVVYVIIGRSKKAVIPTEISTETFPMLCAVINHVSSKNSELNRAVDSIIEHYCDIVEGERPFDVYGSLLAKLCVHPHTDSKVILRFQRAVLAANPQFKDQIENSLKLGLAGRK